MTITHGVRLPSVAIVTASFGDMITQTIEIKPAMGIRSLLTAKMLKKTTNYISGSSKISSCCRNLRDHQRSRILIDLYQPSACNVARLRRKTH